MTKTFWFSGMSHLPGKGGGARGVDGQMPQQLPKDIQNLEQSSKITAPFLPPPG